MLPFKGIQSIQKAVVTKPPPGIPSHYPPQFHIVVGGELGILPVSLMLNDSHQKFK